MKRNRCVPTLAALSVLLLALLLSSCMSAPPVEAPGLDQVVHRWITALHEEDIELLMTTYWPEFQRRGDEWKIIYQTLEPAPGK